MSTSKPTIGQAIDQILAALTPLDKREQQTIVSTVCSFLELEAGKFSQQAIPIRGVNLPVDTGVHSGALADQRTEVVKDSSLPQRPIDIRTLKEQKQPDSARQMACIVSYYLMEHAPTDEKKDTVNTADIERYFKQANYKLPTKLEQLLLDCKKSGYFETVSRGEYKLTRVGYNLVTHSVEFR